MVKTKGNMRSKQFISFLFFFVEDPQYFNKLWSQIDPIFFGVDLYDKNESGKKALFGTIH